MRVKRIINAVLTIALASVFVVEPFLIADGLGLAQRPFACCDAICCLNLHLIHCEAWESSMLYR